MSGEIDVQFYYDEQPSTTLRRADHPPAPHPVVKGQIGIPCPVLVEDTHVVCLPVSDETYLFHQVPVEIEGIRKTHPVQAYVGISVTPGREPRPTVNSKGSRNPLTVTAVMEDLPSGAAQKIGLTFSYTDNEGMRRVAIGIPNVYQTETGSWNAEINWWKIGDNVQLFEVDPGPKGTIVDTFAALGLMGTFTVKKGNPIMQAVE